MKRAGMCIVMAMGALMVGGLAGCKPDDVASLPNPQLDGVLPHQQTGPDMSIMEDQKALHDRMMESAGTPAKSAATQASVPAATTPAATEPAGDSTGPVTAP